MFFFLVVFQTVDNAIRASLQSLGQEILKMSPEQKIGKSEMWNSLLLAFVFVLILQI